MAEVFLLIRYFLVEVAHVYLLGVHEVQIMKMIIIKSWSLRDNTGIIAAWRMHIGQSILKVMVAKY